MAITTTTSQAMLLYAMLHRLINGKSCNVEEQERIFNTITNITKSTSSYHPSHIIGNIFIRLQAEKEMQGFQGYSSSKQEASVSQLAFITTNVWKYLDI